MSKIYLDYAVTTTCDPVFVVPEYGWSKEKLEHPIVDPFWKAFYDALEKYSGESGV